MKTMRFDKTSFGSLFSQAGVLFFLIADIYFLIRLSRFFLDAANEKYWVFYVVYAILLIDLPALVHAEISCYVGAIHLDDKRIRSRGDIRFPREKIQYPASAKYTDIDEVLILPLSRNSKGNHIGLTRPIPFLCIRKKNGRMTRFGLYWMTRRAVKRLLNELQVRCEACGNCVSMDIDQLMQDFKAAVWAVKE